MHLSSDKLYENRELSFGFCMKYANVYWDNIFVCFYVTICNWVNGNSTNCLPIHTDFNFPTILD